MPTELGVFRLPSQEAIEEDDAGGVDLSLGLSIGGSMRKMASKQQLGLGSGEAVEAGCSPGSCVSVSSSSTGEPSLFSAFPQGDRAEDLDPHGWSEVHGKRLQETWKERYAKPQKGEPSCRMGDGATPVAGFCSFSSLREGTHSGDDQVALEAKEKPWRFNDRDAIVEEARSSPRRAGGSHEVDSNLVRYLDSEHCFVINANPFSAYNYNNPKAGTGTNLPGTCLLSFGAHPSPLMAMQYLYPHVQYAPVANGFGIPYMIPWRPPTMSSIAGVPNHASNLHFQRVSWQTFKSFSTAYVDPAKGESPPSLYDRVADSSGGRHWRAVDKGVLPGTDSSESSRTLATSDHHSYSLQAESGSGHDIRSHGVSAENMSRPQQLWLSAGDSVATPDPWELEADAVESPPREKRPCSISADKSAALGVKVASPAISVDGSTGNEPSSTVHGRSRPAPPPGPGLRWMPCVSATGSGPDGRTITGFLYRYTSTEVSIVCVCHGRSFSPSEFVKHAGGSDTENPLKHIVVSPCS